MLRPIGFGARRRSSLMWEARRWGAAGFAARIGVGPGSRQVQELGVLPGMWSSIPPSFASAAPAAEDDLRTQTHDFSSVALQDVAEGQRDTLTRCRLPMFGLSADFRFRATMVRIRLCARGFRLVCVGAGWGSLLFQNSATIAPWATGALDDRLDSAAETMCSALSTTVKRTSSPARMKASVFMCASRSRNGDQKF